MLRRLFITLLLLLFSACHRSPQDKALSESTPRPGASATENSESVSFNLTQGVVTDSLKPGETLSPGQSITSPDKHFTATFGADGYFAITSYKKNVIWSSNGEGGTNLEFQANGNVVVWNAAKAAIWTSGTQNKGAALLKLDNTGLLGVYKADGTMLWSAGGGFSRDRLVRGQQLLPGESIQSPDLRFTATLEKDGSFVLSTFNQHVIWAWKGKDGARLEVQGSNGNVVIWNSAGQALWNTNTIYKAAQTLRLDDTGLLAVYDDKGTILWSVGGGFSSDQLVRGQQLLPGQGLQSPDLRFSATFGKDGNFVLSNFEKSVVVWSSNTQNMSGSRMEFQASNGNFVLWDSAGKALWTTNTISKAAQTLRLDNTGRLAVYDNNGTVLWSVGGGFSTDQLVRGQQLLPGQAIQSPDLRFKATFGTDGHLVLKSFDKDVIWTSPGQGGVRAEFQAVNGNFVIWNSAGKADWNTNTLSKAAQTLRLDNTGLLAVYNNNGAILWSAGGGYLPDRIFTGQEFSPGQALLQSPDLRFKATFGTDGHLVLKSFDKDVIWTSPGQGGARLEFQTVGNLVVWPSSGKAYWNAGTLNKGAQTVRLDNTGLLAIYDNDGTILWSVGGGHPPDHLDPGQQLTSGQFIQSYDLRFTATFEADGNFVLRNLEKNVTWSTQTSGKSGVRLEFQTVGNVVVWPASGKALWQADILNQGGKLLKLDNTGLLAVYNDAGDLIWSTKTGEHGPSDVLNPGDFLIPGNYLLSSDGTVRLDFLANGDLTITRNGTVIWNSGTASMGGVIAALGKDGNFAIYKDKAKTQVVWSTNTSSSTNAGSKLVLGNDGNLSVSKGSSTPWKALIIADNGKVCRVPSSTASTTFQ